MGDLTEPLLPTSFTTQDVGRLSSLDVFRGLSIVGMILVNDAGKKFPTLSLSPWNGASFTDYVMPFFLFVIGVGTALTYRVVESKSKALYKIVLRTAKLFLLGLLLQGGFLHPVGDLRFGVDLSRLRYFGVLQRIAIAFFFVGLSQIVISRSEREAPSQGFFGLLASFLLNWHMALIVGVTYLSLTFLLFVPDWQFTVPPASLTSHPSSSALSLPSANATLIKVHCGVTGSLSPSCNAAGFIDRTLLGLDHMQRSPPFQRLPECSTLSPLPGPLPQQAPGWCQTPFDPDGILGTLGAIMTASCGLHFGHILTHFQGHSVRLSHTFTFSAVLLAVGWLLQFRVHIDPSHFIPSSIMDIPDWLQLNYPGMPFNHSLFSISFVLFTAGAAACILSLVYILVDVAKVRFYTKLFEWVGMNSLLIYVLAATPLFDTLISGFYVGSPQINLLEALKGLFAQIIPNLRYAYLAAVIAKLILWSVLAGLLHSHDVIWKF